MNIVPVNQLTFETFLPQVKTKFRLWLDRDQPMDMDLVEAARLGGAQPPVPNKHGMIQDAFSLMFQGPGDKVLPQGSYSFDHDQIGRFELFIVPVERIPGAIRYQVIFNRLVPAQ